jgi:alkylation response protein AidB-like acyl-CoA dehydrogenase
MAVTLRYDETHALLRQEARRWLAERFPMARVRALADSPRGEDPGDWKALAELGWLGLAQDEADGGAGLGAVALAVVLEESGRALLPCPLLGSTLAGLALAFGGSREQKARWLPRLASGELRAALAHVGPDGGWRAEDASAALDGGRLRGTLARVEGGLEADLFVALVRAEGQPRLALVEVTAPGVARAAENALDRTRRTARLCLDGVALAADALLPQPAARVFERLLPIACVAHAAEMAGGADALLAMTSAYAATREQFERPIGSFQAVKHPLVNVLIQVESVRSLVYAAASALESGDAEAEKLARMAKAAASDAYVFAASRAVQLHGGIGFTQDCDAQLYFKRAQTTRGAWGDALHHRRWLAERL